MRRLCALALMVFTGCTGSGCKVTTVFFVEKNWCTDQQLYTSPDMKTRIQVDVTRDFSQK